MADLTRVNAELAQRITEMIADGKDNNHVYFSIACGFRPLADQERLYAAYKADPKHNALAAEPGTSNHGKVVNGVQQDATAVDLDVVPQTPANIAKHLQLAQKWGLYRAVNGEYWHLELDPNRKPLEEDDMPDMTTDACVTPSGKGRWVLDRNGAVRSYNFDDNNPVPFHGSMFDYPAEQNKPGRYFVSIQPVSANDADGYFIISNDGGAFKLKK